MSTGFKGWCKSIGSTLLILVFCSMATCQPGKLLAELDLENGLPSNAVRCIKLDKDNRAWIGTDKGLTVLNSNTPAIKNIINSIDGKSIWGLEFSDSLVLIGTRFNGLWLFNFYTGDFVTHYLPPQINQIRRIRKIDNNYFVLTNDGPYLWSKGVLAKLTYDKTYTTRFIIDVFKWKDNTYAIPYPIHPLLSLSGNKFSYDSLKAFLPPGEFSKIIDITTCISPGLYFGGYMVYEKSNANKIITYPNLLVNEQASNVIWDGILLKEKLYLAVGETISNSGGFFGIFPKTLPNIPMLAADYVTCLAYDEVNDCMYFGTLQKGLFILPGARESNQSLAPPGFKNLLVNTRHLFYYNNNKILHASISGNRIKKTMVSNSATISQPFLSGDTLLYQTKDHVTLANANTLKSFLNISKEKYLSSTILQLGLLGKSLFTFDSYGKIHRYNLDTHRSTELDNVESFIPYFKIFSDEIFLLNKEKGFSILSETDAYQLNSTDKSIAFTNDFTVARDSLYILIKKNLSSFFIDGKTRTLKPGFSINIDSLVQGFHAKWLLSKNDKIYLLNDEGILRWNQYTGRPLSYYYLGNYNQINAPQLVADSIIFIGDNKVNKISLDDVDNRKIINPQQLQLHFKEAVNENLEFKVSVSYSEFLIQNHALKILELRKGSKLVQTSYSISQTFTFLEGLKYGDYELVLAINDLKLSKALEITLPLSRNPVFFTCILVLIIINFLIAIKSGLDKKELNRKINKNRLQILKQNLNPHFIFNSMNLISSLILEEKYDEAVQVVSDFSSLQRTYLESNNKVSISLEEELNFLSAYLNLQQKRFYRDNNFNYSIHLDDALNSTLLQLPPLILQPLAENAIKYGIIGGNQEDKWIRIDAKGINPVVISIEDNGKHFKNVKPGFGLGKKLVKERIELFNEQEGSRIEIDFNATSQYGTQGYRVAIKIYS